MADSYVGSFKWIDGYGRKFIVSAINGVKVCLIFSTEAEARPWLKGHYRDYDRLRDRNAA